MEWESDEFLIGIVVGVIIISIAYGLIFVPRDIQLDNDRTQLGNAICEEHFGEGSEYSHTEGNDVICKEPKESEEYDGLRVWLE